MKTDPGTKYIAYKLILLLIFAVVLQVRPNIAVATTPFEELGGQVVMEAEHYDANTPRSGQSWTVRTTQSGYSGSGYVEVGPNNGTSIATDYVTTSPEVMYRVKFNTTGTYYIWIRGAGPSGLDDSVHAGIDGTGPASADQMSGFTPNWVWKRDTRDGVPANISVISAGVHTFHLWMREDGMRVDKILLRSSSSSTPPSGTGPVESPRVEEALVASDVLATDVVPNRATISWATNDSATSQVEYGTTTAYGETSPLSGALLERHVVTLTGLSLGTLYHYRVRSQDAAGDLVVSPDQTFTTLSTHVFKEFNGQVVIEAEHYDGTTPRNGQEWVQRSSQAGYSGPGYLEALPNTGITITTGFTTTSPEVVYNVEFTSTGTYYVWIRGAGPSGNDDSLHAGIDGTGPATADEISNFPIWWAWSRMTRDGTPARISVSTPGLHTFHLWMREDGMRVDKILLRKSSSSATPAGAGPSESDGRPRVMAVGDSITQGAGDSDGFGYRDHLEFLLGVGEQEFVGTYRDPTSHPSYDVDHEAVGGETTDQVQARLPAALSAHLPKPNPTGSRLLLHIGTNDMQDRLPVDAVVDNVEQIINMVHAHDPSISIYVALIIPSTLAEDDAVITDYNNALAARVSSLHATKSNLFIVDMNAAFKQNPFWQTAYMADAFHPNDAGYEVMANAWAQGIATNE